MSWKMITNPHSSKNVVKASEHLLKVSKHVLRTRHSDIMSEWIWAIGTFVIRFYTDPVVKRKAESKTKLKRLRSSVTMVMMSVVFVVIIIWISWSQSSTWYGPEYNWWRVP